MIIYRTFSALQVILFFLLKAGHLAIAIVALWHYNDNPVLAVLVASVFVLFFIFTGTDELILKNDCIEFKSSSILKRFRSNRVYRIESIKSFNVEGVYDTGDELYNPSLAKDKSLNTITITLKNNEAIVIKTDIYITKLNKIATKISTMINR